MNFTNIMVYWATSLTFFLRMANMRCQKTFKYDLSNLICFSPSTTNDEQLPKSFYKAEQNGKDRQCSQVYGKLCPNSIFDYVTMDA